MHKSFVVHSTYNLFISINEKKNFKNWYYFYLIIWDNFHKLLLILKIHLLIDIIDIIIGIGFIQN